MASTLKLKDDIYFFEKYHDITEIKYFYDEIMQDTFTTEIYDAKKANTDFCGSWDRPLRLEIKGNPFHKLLDKIQDDFGQFDIITGSVRHLASPFLPHLDVNNRDTMRLQHYSSRKYGTFVIPLAWKDGYKAGTGFYTSPPSTDEDLYVDHLDKLPEYSPTYKDEELMFSVKKIAYWQNPGDLVSWNNLQWHSTTDPHNWEYSKEEYNWIKQFITIRVLYRDEEYATEGTNRIYELIDGERHYSTVQHIP